MKTSLWLLLCCLWPVGCLRVPTKPTKKPNGLRKSQSQSIRLPKAEDDTKYRIIDFSDDVDGEPDSSGEITRATLNRPDMPRDFAICIAFMVQFWNTPYNAVTLFEIIHDDGTTWGNMLMYPGVSFIQFTVWLGNVDFESRADRVLFPFTWTRGCFSLDTVSGRVRIVLDGQVLEDKVHQEALEEDELRPPNLNLVLGYDGSSEDTGMASNVNIFSLPLSTESMVAMTQAGHDECGAPGDYVNWEKAEWNLTSAARMEMVGELESPCRRESEVTVYTADFEYHSSCMYHCQKLGQGRSPPVQTLEQYHWMFKEVHAITKEVWRFDYLWVSITDEEKEEVWRDFYSPHDKIETGVAWPYYSDKKDTTRGENYNCMSMYTDETDPNITWYEHECYSWEMACPCMNKKAPILQLRGLCPKSELRTNDESMGTQYLPKQLAKSPTDIILVGGISTRIQYNDNSSQWILTNLVHSVTAVSDSSKISYVLGKHEWTVTNDVFECNKGQPYTTVLKLTGCNPDGEFTCDDGQCVNMIQRCNQIPNCRDESDEVNCKLVIVKNTYNMKVPPIIPTEGDNFDATKVAISIRLLKIVSMEEVLHKIELQFEVSLEWKENRANYQNLKKKTSLNALTDAEIETLWLPYVIYSNTDMKEAVQLDYGLKTTIVVTREGNFTRSGSENIDEIEIFRGSENKLVMSQTYTKNFQCPYNLQRYPFDTQVKNAI